MHPAHDTINDSFLRKLLLIPLLKCVIGDTIGFKELHNRDSLFNTLIGYQLLGSPHIDVSRPKTVTVSFAVIISLWFSVVQ